MKRYTAALQRHLTRYAVERLGVSEHGIYKGRPYGHILPRRLRDLNLLESVRAELLRFLSDHPTIALHQFFHHLNSSQAFAFNLFYPFFIAGGNAARALVRSLGVDVRIHTWEFEAVPLRAEGTNVDVLWTTVERARVFCEVKLSETEFGQARNDLRHQTKLTQLYAPRLRSLVSDELLVPATFFKHYQLLRNISQLAENDVDHLVFLLPRENEALRAPLDRVLSHIASGVRRRIHVAHVEDCIDALEANEALPAALRMHSSALKEKYIPSAVDMD